MKARILVVDDDTQMQLALKTSLSRSGHEVLVAADGKPALELLANQSFDLIISDQRMPEMGGLELLKILQDQGSRTPFIIITAHGTIDQAVQAMQLGAADFITKPFSLDELEQIVDRVLSPENQAYREQSRNSDSVKPRAIVTTDGMMIRVLEVAEAVAKSDATVLIQGESGTGKELIARLIHSTSQRAKQPFIAVNCAALPENLLESELFGHEKGAFTGAQTKKLGKFEMAHGGTILLDEISEMDVALQAKLLRVIQEREVDRVGGRDPISIDVRVLATTNRNLEQAVKLGTFRADLYYRLNVIPLTLPPLRERKGDILPLVNHFMRKFLGEKAAPLSSQVLSALENHPWPGNIRELENAVKRAAILSAGRIPETGHFLLDPAANMPNLAPPLSISQQSMQQSTGVLVAQVEVTRESEAEQSKQLLIRSGLTVEEVERSLILETLKATDNNRTQAAKLLGISIRTLRNKLHEYGYSKGIEDDGIA